MSLLGLGFLYLAAKLYSKHMNSESYKFGEWCRLTCKMAECEMQANEYRSTSSCEKELKNLSHERKLLIPNKEKYLHDEVEIYEKFITYSPNHLDHYNYLSDFSFLDNDIGWIIILYDNHLYFREAVNLETYHTLENLSQKYQKMHDEIGHLGYKYIFDDKDDKLISCQGPLNKSYPQNENDL